MEPSTEQKTIITSFLDGKSVACNAVAGSGKTTTMLMLAKELPSECKILLLTYNKRLRFEVQAKIGEDSNVDPHTYHSFAVKYLDYNAHTDKGIKDGLEKRSFKEFAYDYLFVDEIQDMTPLYYELVWKIIVNAGIKQLFMVGDIGQCIYVFNGANPMFLTEVETIFPDFKWVHCQLTTSYRITNKMELFLNNVVFRKEKIVAHKKSHVKVDYLRIDPYGRGKQAHLYPYFKSLLKDYSPTDIMVLAPSVKIKDTTGKNMNPVCAFANAVSNMGISIYVPNADQEKVDKDIFNGKLPFLSFHQAKGLEAKVVIVFHFDSSYFKYYNKSAPQDICPNELYVATTRAKEKLVLLHGTSAQYLPFIDPSYIERYANVIGNLPESVKLEEISTAPTSTIPLCMLFGNMTLNLQLELEKYISYETVVHESANEYKVPTKIKVCKLFEDVSDINGTMFASYFHYKTTGTMAIIDELISEKKIDDFVKENIDNLTLPNLLEIANKYNSLMSGYIFKINQIQDYDWLGKLLCNKSPIVSEFTNRLENAIPSPYGFEHKVKYKAKNGVVVIGRIDCFSGRNIWEIKCVSSVKLEHLSQVVLYTMMFNQYRQDLIDYYGGMEKEKIPAAEYGVMAAEFHPRLFNVYENVTYIVSCSDYQKVMNLVIDNYFQPKKPEDYDDFISKCESIRNIAN